MSTEKPVQQQPSHKDIVWVGKPYITPAAVIRTVTIFVFTAALIVLEFYVNIAQFKLWILPLYFWTLLIFIIIWIFSLLGLIVFRYSNTYTLRQDGLEVRNGILRLRSFLVTPQAFGDLLVYQSIGGRILSYGDIVVNSQGEREVKLRLVHAPFKVADTIRDVMGKPIVRVEGHV